MSIGIVWAAALLATVLGVYAGEVAEAASLHARAQIAADAAALASVAESGPYGRTEPELQARRLAEANGAELVACWCEPGGTAVQVEVEVSGVTAEARAVLDAGALAPMRLGFDSKGLHPAVAGAVERLTTASGGRIWVVSGYRTRAKQASLWKRALDEHGSAEAADDWVARPGTSMHERGLAVDLGGDIPEAVALIEELSLPLFRPLRNEPWHFELSARRHTDPDLG